jgi:hypothetical protein
MSMNGLQHVVCRAAIDSDFIKLLARSPIDALHGFDVDDDEVSMFESLRPQSLRELACAVEAWRRGDALVPQRPLPEPAVVVLAS